MLYQCPLCQSPLAFIHQHFLCKNNHQFDCAKEGYVNLMPAQHKHSKNPGDNQMMMQARRDFLNSGAYQPLRDYVVDTIQKHIDLNSTINLLDIGCGEGYYTGYLAERIGGKSPASIVYGLDIAKIAVRYAAKRYKQAHFCVASSYRLPFLDNTIDAVLRIYAPCKAEEIYRVTSDSAIVVTVAPAPRHLFQLKSVIYDVPKPHDEIQEEIDGFSLIEENRLSYPLELTGEQAVNLLLMTPFAWRATPDARQALIQQDCFVCDTDFFIRVYQKNRVKI